MRKQDPHSSRPNVIPVPYDVEGCEISECPTSYVTQRSWELVQQVSTLMSSYQCVGSSVPADHMPGSLLDAIRICQRETKAAEAAQDEAVNNA